MENKYLNKDLILKNVNKKFSGKLYDIVLKQIDTYFELNDSNYVIDNKYNIGDLVYLNENHILHGIGRHIDILEIIASRGIVSQDYFGDKSNHAFGWESAFWIVKDRIMLGDYIKNYSGMIAKVKDKYIQVPYGKLDDFVEKMKDVDHWLWTAESSMEIRFMPSLARNINQIGFIVNMESELAKELRKNSVFKEGFELEYALEFVGYKEKEKFMLDGFSDDFFRRADYLIFGVPRCLIEGIVVGKIVENNPEYLEMLKKLFNNCYICNLEGKVIY